MCIRDRPCAAGGLRRAWSGKITTRSRPDRRGSCSARTIWTRSPARTDCGRTGIFYILSLIHIFAACREKGVLVIKAKDKLRLLPALNIPMEQLQKAVAVIKECCAE